MRFQMLNNKTVLVSGGTGMIGSQLIRRLLEIDGVKVIGLFRNEAKRDFLFPENHSNLSWVKCDIGKELSIPGDLDYIVHTAGVTGGSKQHVDYPMTTINTALNGTMHMLELAKEKKVQGFVFLSSLEIYGKTASGDSFIKETDGGYIDTTSVRSSYSESKRMCETICAAYCKQFDVPAKIVRLAPTYGKGASYSDNRVLCEFARCAIEKKDIVLKSLGETVRNYCDVDDAADAILIVLTDGVKGEAYNIANMDIEVSIKQLAERVVSLYPQSGIHLKFDLAEDITKLGYNQTIKIRLDSTKLMQLGWMPHHGLDQMIINVVDAMTHAKHAMRKE